MREIELSVMDHGEEMVQSLRNRLKQFEAQHHINVRLNILSWDEAWAELVKIVIYRSGPHASEIGNTWVSDFVGMNALRPFQLDEIAALGGEEAFVSAIWKSGQILGKPDMWAIPFYIDTRLLYYRRDLYEQVQVETENGFADFASLENTLEQIKAKGIPYPWIVPSQPSRMNVHHMAAWIWGSGGEFVQPDGKQVAFHQPEALDGMEKYFRLGRFIPISAQNLSNNQSDAFFRSGQAATTMSGAWLLMGQAVRSTVVHNSGIVPPPGVPYVGGSQLVVWKHTEYEQEAVELVRFLSDPEFQHDYTYRTGILPVRMEVLRDPSFSQDPFYHAVSRGIQSGRSFPAMPLWGLLEDRLTSEVWAVWKDLFANPDQSVREIVEAHMIPLAQRLNLLLV